MLIPGQYLNKELQPLVDFHLFPNFCRYQGIYWLVKVLVNSFSGLWNCGQLSLGKVSSSWRILSALDHYKEGGTSFWTGFSLPAVRLTCSHFLHLGHVLQWFPNCSSFTLIFFT